MASEGNQILGMRSDVRGTAHLRLEAYWVFDTGGPVELKPHEVVHDAIRELLPADGYIREAENLNMPRMCYVTPVSRPENDVSGSLLVKFALKGTSLIVTHKDYTTSRDGFDRHEKECPQS
jgi:hypothetical protein